MSSKTPLDDQQLGNRHEPVQHGDENQARQRHLQAALDRSAIMPGQPLWGSELCKFRG